MNIVLIGMPGSGKSTVGVLLAKSLLCDFVDTDLIIQKKMGLSLCDILEKHGIDGFVEIENGILSDLHCDNTVIATGGSAVYGKEAMENLKQIGNVVYLKVDPAELEKRISNITTRGIAMPKNSTLAELYAERAPLYEMYADIIIECTGNTVEQSVETVRRAAISIH